MTRGLLEVEYPTSIYPHGVPEEIMQGMLCAREPAIWYRLIGAGTDLVTGFRDVQIEVHGSLADINEIVLAANGEGLLAWKFTPDPEDKA